MTRKRIADKEPASSQESVGAAPQKSAAKAPANKTRAPRASANAVTHRHKKNATGETLNLTAVDEVAAPVVSDAVVSDPVPTLATPVETLAAVPQPVENVVAARPAHEQIAIRAYFLSEAEGFQGSPEGYWFEAESQLVTEKN